MNICMCGAQDGYPHDRFCPYPLYKSTDEEYRHWSIQYQEKKTQSDYEHTRPDADTEGRPFEEDVPLYISGEAEEDYDGEPDTEGGR